MQDEAAKANTFDYVGEVYPRIQLLTVRQILEEKREFSTPAKVGSRIKTGQTYLPV
jgi:hypothetical protein